MTEHELLNTFTVNTTEGGLSLQEWRCGNKYKITDTNAEYCPRCGEEL
jgi:hypothetical protein